MAEVYTIPSKNKATGCLILLHGSGDNGLGFKQTIEYLRGPAVQFPHVKIILPTAPLIPFSAFGGMLTNTWFDVTNFSEDAVENYSHIKQSGTMISKIISDQISEGIPADRIAVAGFSRGGAMSYYIGYMFCQNLAGVGVMSSWLPKSSKLYETLTGMEEFRQLPPLFQSHGTADQMARLELGERTVKLLKSFGVSVKFLTYPSVGHELTRRTLEDLYSFIMDVIPSTTSVKAI